MKEQEVKYILHLLECDNNNIIKECLQIYYNIEEKKYCDILSDELIDFFTLNLKTNPVTTSCIMLYLKRNCVNEAVPSQIQKLYLDEIKSELQDPNNIDKLAAIITLWDLDDKYIPQFTETVLHFLSQDICIQHRKQMLISLVSQKNPKLLALATQLLRKKEKQKVFKLTPEYMLELCYCEKTHWLLKAAQVYKQQLHDLKNVTFKINDFTKQILIMVLIDLTNSPESYDLPSLVQQLGNIYSILETYDANDDQLNYYMMEVKRELTVIKFCLENNCKIMTTSIFGQILNKSALAIISQLCTLSKVDRYKVSKLLNSNNETLNELSFKKGIKYHQLQTPNLDILTYNSYCAISKIIDTIITCTNNDQDSQDLSSALDEIKRYVLSINPVQYSIEVIENLFSCLFLRYEYFSCVHIQEVPCGTHSDCSYFYSKKLNKNWKSAKQSSAGFMCKPLLTQVILNTLKLCLESIEEKLNEINVDQGIVIKFKHLVKVVNHAIFKLQLVSSLTPNDGMTPLKLCLDYVDVEDSSEDENHEYDLQVSRKKYRSRKKYPNLKGNPMLTSTISANGEGSTSNLENTIDFISLMLAKPNCLVALALHHNDFSKANQIIEMFDLADADIATEVTFTEQLRNLVAKIKNIIYYKDDSRYPAKELSRLSVVSTEVMSLVEGFLASNRAPNSFDIMELASRHPHLQLYSHQNAHFVNAVDILISSGLNREITYGLINIVERKLAEVRNCTDVASVKKTNYIRFVEDIASVVFEILGSTDKSFDLVDNVCSLIIDSRIPIKHKEFCKMNQLSKELRKSCEDLVDIVNGKIQLEMDSSLLQKYHHIYMNVVAASDKDLFNIADVYQQGNKKSRTHYLRMCYMYCKTVAQLEISDSCSNDSNPDASYFSMLEKQLHEIFGNMINDQEISIAALEPICRKLNVNLIPKLILNFCPSICMDNHHKEASETNFNNLLQIVYDFKNTEENLFIEHTADLAPLPRAPDPQSLTYIVLNNWVLAHLVKKIHSSNAENNLQQSMDSRTKYINNYMELERFNYLKDLFDNNKYLASLHTNIDLDEIFLFMPRLLKSGKLLRCLNIIDALSERQLAKSANLTNLRDMILYKLAIHPRIENNYRYSEHLKCSDLKIDLILNNLNCWPLEGALSVLTYLKYLLDPSVLDEGLHEKCIDWISKIPLYDQIASIIGLKHWYDIYEKSIDNQEEIVEILMDSQQYKLCLEWANAHGMSDNMKSLIVTSLLRQLFEYTNQATPELVKELLNQLPTNQAVEVVHEEMSKVKNVEIMVVCVDFLSEHSTDFKSLENIKIGLQIMLEMTPNLRPVFWDLIEKPLVMIEQFLMNAKLDILTDIIAKISGNLKRDPSGDNLYYNMKSIEKLVISRNAVDALLRFYAEKALDMRNPCSRNAYTSPKSSDDTLLQSIDSINIEASSKPFVMPEQVPSKDQWVEDYSTDKCMLCHTSIFSMIIRRHHCRRCGRLVCHACSRNRMQVPTYPSGVKFRVCDDCYTQSTNKTQRTEQEMMSSNSDSAGSGVTAMDWCLSTSPKKNGAVRAEFSYEFTPNVTLCLSIMKMHSYNLDYPRFLLDRADEVAREVCAGDARMLLRARRTLLLAASELYARAPAQNGDSSGVAEAGALHAARCLSHADALHTLVTHCARTLAPHHDLQPSHIVRSLLEAEKWELALEIATKSGLQRSSVLAAWGKACLKAGCFKQAREKFALCFKNAPQLLCTEINEECEYGKEASEFSPFVNRRVQSVRWSERSSSVSSAQSDGRPRNNPPLLNEIVSILEQMNYPVNQLLLNKAENMKSTNEKLTMMNTGKKKISVTEPALNIMHTLASVKKIRQGDYSDFQTATVQPKKSIAQGLLRRNNNQEQKTDYQQKKLDPFFYKECLYYLSNYGSHVANILFYMKYSDLSEVLKYCYDNLVDRDTFTESVFMECMRKEKIEDLLKGMSDMDSTFEMWAEYITSICRYLESSGKLETLYAVQTGTGQTARAAATCARLYARVTPRTRMFAVLLARQHRLAAAAHHLQLVVPSANKPSDSKSFHMHLDKATIDKHMTTINRQMEVAKYLAACESKGRLSEKMTSEVIPLPIEESKSKDVRPLTLFGSNTDRIRLVALILVAGESVEEGFNLAFRIITENKLDSMNIYTHVAKYLVQTDRFAEVKILAKCIRASKETAASLMSDQVLERGVSAVVARCEQRGQLHDEMAELLIEDIHSLSIKISCYITCRILSSAYILAARHDRTTELRRVLHEAERLGNDQIRNACLKRLSAKTGL